VCMPFHHERLEAYLGIEPRASAWKAEVLSHYTSKPCGPVRGASPPHGKVNPSGAPG
jgi:hypothetical protein